MTLCFYANICLIDPDFAAGEYIVNHSCMDSPEHYVKKCCDSDDISYQYALALGNYRENRAFLRCHLKHRGDRTHGFALAFTESANRHMQKFLRYKPVETNLFIVSM